VDDLCRSAGNEGAALPVADLSDSRILVVDDQPDNLRVLTTVLELKGYRHVHCLDDSRCVVPAVLEIQPDLILLDLHMPHVDGIAVMDQLGGVIAEDDYLPVLVLTGDNTSAARERALSHGAHDFISKPLNRTEVQLRVKNLLQTRWLHLQRKAQNTSLKETNRRLRETQAHLVQSEKMASLGQLVAGIAHEVNNPLAFVINNLFLAQEGLDRLAGQQASISAQVPTQLDKVRTQIRNSCQGAERVKDLVSKLRTFSRLDEGKFKTVNIHESIESVLLFLRHKLEDRIEVERNYRAPDMLACYSGELNQVLMNVIANAIDSIEGRGKVTLTTEQLDGYFVIVVRDTGKGIPEEIRSKVFEPFFTTKPVGHGTGLGLAISYGILKAHRGSIDFSSELGKGTEFMLRIPTGLQADA
jgi:two-component system, NtrC family, sensor kinase